MFKFSLKIKILFLFIFFPVLTFGTISIISGININSLVILIFERGRELGSTAVHDNRKNMEREFNDELKTLADIQAAIIEIHLQRIAIETKNMAQLYLDLQNNSGVTLNPNSFRQYDSINVRHEFSPLSFANGMSQETVTSEFNILNMTYNSLKIVYACNRHAHSLGIATADGVFIGYSWYPYPAYFDPRKQEWYRNAIAKPNTAVFTGPYKDICSSEEYITCSYAIMSSGKPIVVAMANMSPETVSENLILGINNSTPPFIVTRDGKFITKNGVFDKKIYGSEDISELRYSKDLIKAICSGESGVKRYIHRNEKYYVSYAPLKAVDWSVCFTLAEKIINSSSIISRNKIEDGTATFKRNLDTSITNSRLIYSFAGLVIFVLIIWGAVYCARRVHRAISVLESGAIRISHGELDAVITLDTNDEFQELAESFNRMAENIKINVSNINQNLSEQEIINSDLAAAAKIQSSMFPAKFPAFPERTEFDIYALHLPAREVGGDFYDYCLIDNEHLYCCIGDISDRGVPAALFMVKIQTLLRYEAIHNASPAQMILNVERDVVKSNQTGVLASVICAIINLKTGEMQIASAGHAPPLLYHSPEFCFCKLPSAPAIGSRMINEDCCVNSDFTMGKGDILFLYTKGVTEANIDGASYSTSQLLRDLQVMAGANPKEIIDYISQCAVRFADTVQGNDMTMLSMKFQG